MFGDDCRKGPCNKHDASLKYLHGADEAGLQPSIIAIDATAFTNEMLQLYGTGRDGNCQASYSSMYLYTGIAAHHILV